MRKKHLRVIQDIQRSIPRELLDKLMRKEIQAPTMIKVLQKALEQPDTEVSPRKKRAIRALLNSGNLDREVEVIDTEIEKVIDAFVSAEIDKAVKLGRLPKKAPMLESLQAKGTRYARRQEKRLRREFGVEALDVDDAPQDDPDDEAEHAPRAPHHLAIPAPSCAVR